MNYNDFDDEFCEEIVTIEEYAPTTIINGDIDLSGIQHDIENLTELIKGNQDDIKKLEKSDIVAFTTSKPSADGLIIINATTNDSNEIQAFYIYNGLDGKYPNAALSAQQGKVLNDKITALEKKVLELENAINEKI